jgi:predicted metal-dependent TIM-barrel fold hydrolase
MHPPAMHPAVVRPPARTVRFLTKATPPRAVGMLEQFAAERVWLNSACDWGPSDPVAVPRAAAEMRRRGHSPAAIDALLYGNPVRFLSQAKHFRDPQAPA